MRPSLIACLLAASCAGGAAAPAASWPDLPWPPDGDLTNATALSRLLPLPSEPGNACADYLRLTAPEGQPPPHADLGVGLDAREKGTDEAKATLARLAADAEVVARLQAFRAGARKRDCRTFGDAYSWPTEANPMRWKLPVYQPIFAHAEVAERLAWELADKGDLAEAIAWHHALIVAGWHLQQDALLIANMIGVALQADAAASLADLLAAHGGDATLAERWRAYAGLARWRRHEAYVQLLKKVLTPESLATAEGIERLAAIADSPQMMRGARAEAIVWVAHAHLLRPGAPEPSARQRELIARFAAAGDAALAELARRLEATFAWDAAERARHAEELAKDLAASSG